MTPMIDVIFLLLTFFLLTANFRTPEDFLPLTLPSNSQADLPGVIEPLAIRISANPKGTDIHIGGTTTVKVKQAAINKDLADFSETFRNILNTQKRGPHDPIEIHCEDQVAWNYLVKVYHILNAFGVDNVTFAIKH